MRNKRRIVKCVSLAELQEKAEVRRRAWRDEMYKALWEFVQSETFQKATWRF